MTRPRIVGVLAALTMAVGTCGVLRWSLDLKFGGDELQVSGAPPVKKAPRAVPAKFDAGI